MLAYWQEMVWFLFLEWVSECFCGLEALTDRPSISSLTFKSGCGLVVIHSVRKRLTVKRSYTICKLQSLPHIQIFAPVLRRQEGGQGKSHTNYPPHNHFNFPPTNQIDTGMLAQSADSFWKASIGWKSVQGSTCIIPTGSAHRAEENPNMARNQGGECAPVTTHSSVILSSRPSCLWASRPFNCFIFLIYFFRDL